MLKKLLVSGLIVILLLAAGASAYNVVFTQAAEGEVEENLVVEDEKTPIQPSSLPGQPEANALPAQESQDINDQSPITPKSESSLQADPNSSDIQTANGQGNRFGKQGNQNQGQGQGQTRGRGGNRGQAGSSGANQPAQQNGFQEWVTLQGVVSEYLAPDFTLLLADGQIIQAQLGNISFVESLGLNLKVGESVSVMGFYDPEGGFAVGQITLQSSGETFILRNDQGRPAWAGGGNQ
jgi:hypothetical protein